jgi:hypothetical protein
MHAPHENVHNGGLIDFHESVLRADLNSAIYAHAQAAAAQNQYQSGLQAPYQCPPVASSPYAMAGPMMPLPGGFQPPIHPGMGAPLPQGPSQCIAGPPSFVHLHGQMYKPVEPAPEATGAPADAGRQAIKEAPAPPSVKSIDRMVEKRVEQRVNEFLAKTSRSKASVSRSQGRRGRQDPNDPRDALRGLNQEMRRGF